MAAELRIGGFIPGDVTRHTTQTGHFMSFARLSVRMPYKAFLKLFWEIYILTSIERQAARYERRKAERDGKRKTKLRRFDDFEQITGADNLYSGVHQMLPPQCRVEGIRPALRSERHAEHRRNASQADCRRVRPARLHEITLHERGKKRHIKSVHISERIIQKALSDYVMVPILSNPLVYDNGASIKGKGVHFRCATLLPTCPASTGATDFQITDTRCSLTSQNSLTTSATIFFLNYWKSILAISAFSI
jgi:hypothetical protein